MSYQVVLRPLDGNGAPAKVAIGADGVGPAEQVLCQTTDTNMLDTIKAVAANSIGVGYYHTVIVAAVGNNDPTNHPSNVQLTGLEQYLALILAGSDTSSVETALTALQ